MVGGRGSHGPGGRWRGLPSLTLALLVVATGGLGLWALQGAEGAKRLGIAARHDPAVAEPGAPVRLEAIERVPVDGSPTEPEPEPACVRVHVVAAESGAPVESVGMEGPDRFGGQPGADAVFDDLQPGRFVLDVGAPGRLPHRIDVTLAPGESRDLGTLRLPLALAVGGTVRGPGGKRAAGGLVRLGELLPEAGVVSWTADRWTRTGPDGRFRFERVAPGRHRLRCDRIDDPLASGDSLDLGSAGVWVDVGTRDVTDVELDLEPLFEVVVPARADDARTRSLRIHDASGYELRSEWVTDEARSLWLVRGEYEVAWWDEARELERVPLRVAGGRVELGACP